MYHESQEDSQNGAKSQVAGHLHLGAATNPKFKPTLEFYKPFPYASPQLKIVQGNALQGTELMSRLGLQNWTLPPQNLVSLPIIKLLSTAVPNTFRVYKKGRQQQRETPKLGMRHSHKECVVGRNSPSLAHGNFGRCSTIESQNRGPAPAQEKHLIRSRSATKLFHDTFPPDAKPLTEKCSPWACERTKLPLPQNSSSSAGSCHDQRIWIGGLSQQEESAPVTCLATWRVQFANMQKTQIILIKTIQIPTSNS